MNKWDRERRQRYREQFRPDDFDRDRTDFTVLVRSLVIIIILVIYSIARWRS